MATLTKQQVILIEGLKDDIEFYKDELDSQFKTHRILLICASAAAVVMAVLLITFPGLLKSLQAISEHMGTLAGFASESIPVVFASKSFNKGNIVKKKKKGLRVFVKNVERLEQGILPNKSENILSLEQELVKYINT